jgi:hypothetical protein
MGIQDTIATIIRAWHRTTENRAGPDTQHTGEGNAAQAIVALLRATPALLLKPDMFWDAASPESPIDDLSDVRDNTGYGEITEVWQAIRAPTIFVAWLGPRDDADSDDDLYFEGESLAAVQALLDAELAARNQTL